MGTQPGPGGAPLPPETPAPESNALLGTHTAARPQREARLPAQRSNSRKHPEGSNEEKNIASLMGLLLLLSPDLAFHSGCAHTHTHTHTGSCTLSKHTSPRVCTGTSTCARTRRLTLPHQRTRARIRACACLKGTHDGLAWRSDSTPPPTPASIVLQGRLGGRGWHTDSFASGWGCHSLVCRQPRDPSLEFHEGVSQGCQVLTAGGERGPWPRTGGPAHAAPVTPAGGWGWQRGPSSHGPRGAFFCRDWGRNPE